MAPYFTPRSKSPSSCQLNKPKNELSLLTIYFSRNPKRKDTLAVYWQTVSP